MLVSRGPWVSSGHWSKLGPTREGLARRRCGGKRVVGDGCARDGRECLSVVFSSGSSSSRVGITSLTRLMYSDRHWNEGPDVQKSKRKEENI
jgi:hypothetical protein